MNPDIDSLLKDLGQALIDAVSESPDVAANLLRLRQSGYSLYLTVDCKQESEAEEAEQEAGSRRLPLRDTPARSTSLPLGGEPSFRINTGDLSFLRSIGIDPTRKGRSRRSN